MLPCFSSSQVRSALQHEGENQNPLFATFQFLSGSISTSTPPYSTMFHCRLNCFSSSQVRSALQHTWRKRHNHQHAASFSSSQVRSALQLIAFQFLVEVFFKFQFLSGSISTSTRRIMARKRSRTKSFSSSQVRSALQRVVIGRFRLFYFGQVSVPLRFDQHFNLGGLMKIEIGKLYRFSSSQVRSALQRVNGTINKVRTLGFSSSQVRSALQPRQTLTSSRHTK